VATAFDNMLSVISDPYLCIFWAMDQGPQSEELFYQSTLPHTVSTIWKYKNSSVEFTEALKSCSTPQVTYFSGKPNAPDLRPLATSGWTIILSGLQYLFNALGLQLNDFKTYSPTETLKIICVFCSEKNIPLEAV
jgi:hypothetical protein